VPLAQAVSRKPVQLHQQPVYVGGYDIDQDPLWTTSPEPDAVDALAWYQCDHLGTPQELTDTQGEVVWSAQYKVWGMAKEVISTAAQAAGIRNPIRFQGQYWDRETGLHYNRHRYYDPEIGRFIAKDPIGFAGGLNVYQYADNPVEWVDPLGLTSCFFRGSRKCEPANFYAKPGDYRIDQKSGLVKTTHGVSVFNNPESVESKGFYPHKINMSTVGDNLKIIQRGNDLKHYEIVPTSPMTLDAYQEALSKIKVF